jgi:hypothetical protein
MLVYSQFAWVANKQIFLLAYTIFFEFEGKKNA